MHRFFRWNSSHTPSFSSQLFDEETFYQSFSNDLKKCENEIIIESPYITSTRIKLFYPIFKNLLARDVSIYIVTRDPNEQENEILRKQAEVAIHNFERLGIHTLLCVGNHHRKIAILDRKILWEGSINILSQTYSREIMRRIEGQQHALEMLAFLRFESIM